MENKLAEAKKQVELYFGEHLPKYEVLEVRRKSFHPDDSYLYMVSAKKEDGTYAVWTSWNEETQSLNHGHYNISSAEDCEKIFAEFQAPPVFEVFKFSHNLKSRLFVAANEEDAKRFCEYNDWQIKDENGFVWDLDYSSTQ